MNLITIEKIPAFCINLQHRTDRWANMEARFKKYDIKVERWNAITPDTVIGNYVHYLSPYQRACTYSHISLYLEILQRGYEYVLILEDDAAFRPDWKEIVNDKLAKIQNEDPDWDALFLNVAEETEPFESWVPAKNQCLSAAYVIRRKAIEYILHTFADQYYCIDWMTQILQTRGHSYTYFPWLVIQEMTVSDIQSGFPLADFAKVKRLLEWAKYPIEKYDISV